MCMQAFFGHVHQNVDAIELHNNNIIILPPDFINHFLSGISFSRFGHFQLAVS